MDNFQTIKSQYTWIDDKEWQWFCKGNKLHLGNVYTG